MTLAEIKSNSIFLKLESLFSFYISMTLDFLYYEQSRLIKREKVKR